MLAHHRNLHTAPLPVASLLIVVLTLADFVRLQAEEPTETLRQPPPLEQLLKEADMTQLAREARRRGDPHRGALLFYKSAAACAQCHGSDDDATPLGPDLARPEQGVTDQYLVESILFPAEKIRPGYETVSVLTTDGQLVRGMLVSQDDSGIVLRDASDLLREVKVAEDQIEAVSKLDTSMMPDGLIPVLGGLKEFYDLTSYVLEVAHGGPSRAAELKPSEDELVVVDDTENLDHAGIIRGMGKRDFAAGEAIYHGYCYSCHGRDGNTPSLATARAFGKEKLKFGADPYRLFMTLSKGNGLMAPMTQLTPKERYQVAHYIRQQFIKPGGIQQVDIEDDYLASLPEGSDSGERILSVARDYGPALASQLQRRVNSALTIKLGPLTASYDLHRMDLAGVWSGGFLNLDQTQHIRGRGEGVAEPAGPLIDALSYRRWGHGGTLDYPTDRLPPRGPAPEDWLDYHGHHLHGDRLVFSYAIDRREILELPEASSPDAADSPLLSHTLRLAAGPPLLLAVARKEHLGNLDANSLSINQPVIAKTVVDQADEASGRLAVLVRGQRDGLQWVIDAAGRLVLQIPADDSPRLIRIDRTILPGPDGHGKQAARLSSQLPPPTDPQELVAGGAPRWPDVLTTTGYLGLEPGGYALDTLPVPRATPWNTWFRTSAIDFLSDGRMVVTTYGGDVWIVDGVDDQLLQLRWKRFAGGLYEPMGVKVVDDTIYVTCKDRLTRLHDLNGNGEADFYESFAADPDVSVNFHAFNFDLQVDAEGNFYYAKSGHGADTELPGAVYQISPDGKYREVYSTGFRTPNGMGSMPGNRITASDNEGQWTPASKINLLQPGGFYGWVQTYDGRGRWAPGGGEIDLDKVVPPESFDRPLVYMPQVLDNSSGGQLWADDPRWGPLAGHLLHTSFGRGWMYYLLVQEVDDIAQAAIIKLPFDFQTGIMRASVNPADGQVYATGLDGWNGGGRAGLLDHGIQRLRYTGRPHRMVSHFSVQPGGLRLSFNFPLHAETAAQPNAYQAQHWNYLWQAAYGSKMYSPSTGDVGIDPLEVTGVHVEPDGRTVHLRIPELVPVDQLHLIVRLEDESGEPFEEEIYATINRLPQDAASGD